MPLAFMMRDRAEGKFLAYTHEFLSHMLGANRKSVTLAAQSMQNAGLISYRRGTIQIVNRPALEKASGECYAIVKKRFDAFLTPPATAVQGAGSGRKQTMNLLPVGSGICFPLPIQSIQICAP